MSAQTTSENEHNDPPSIAQRFHETFPSAWENGAIHGTNHEQEVDGRAWRGGERIVLLAAPETTRYGYVDFADASPAEYVDTRTACDRRAYTFTAGETLTAIDVQYLRDAANEVFDVSYDTMKRNAYTVSDPDIEGCPEGVSPVLFRPPNTEYTLLIAPLMDTE